MATIKDLAEQYGLEDYEQLLGGYPNAEKFITGLKDAAVRSVPTTEQMRDPNFIIDNAGIGGIIKPKGGNWLDAFGRSPEKSATQFGRHDDSAEMRDWLKQKLGKYIQNEMATPEDPIRRIAEEWPAKRDVLISQQQSKIPKLQDLLAKYEQDVELTPEVLANRIANTNRDIGGIQDKISEFESYNPLHYTPRDPSEFDIDDVMAKREIADYPEEGIAKTHLGKLWEHHADDSITPIRVKSISDMNEENNPWLKKLDEEDQVYFPNIITGTGFDKLTKELRSASRPDTDLPDFLRIDPAKLSRVSVPQAVEHVAKINAWRDAEKLKEGRNAATVMHKEYPDQGLSWMQMKMPEPTLQEGHYIAENSRGNPAIFDQNGVVWSTGTTPEDALLDYKEIERRDALKAALKFEGDTMGHCVGQYCDEVAGGDSNIYSLRDRRGEPHVTIETKNNGYDLNKLLDLNKQMINEDSYLTDKLKYLQENYADRPERQADLMLDTMKKYGYDYQLPEPMGKIVQIKGKQNAAPNAKYLPAVHDFVRSKDWSSVGDLQNTLLTDLRKDEQYMHPDLYKMATDKYGRFATDDEMDALRDEFYIKNIAGNKFANGGLVGGSVDAQDDEGYLDDLDRLKKAYERSNFGPNDSVIASTIHHPIEAAKRAKDSLMRSIDTAGGVPREILDESSAFPFGIAPSMDEQAQAGLDLAGLAQTGAMPFAPESAGGTLGTLHKFRIGDLGYDLRFDDRKLEQDKLQNMVLQLSRPENEKRIISLANYEGYPWVTSMSDRTNVGNLHYINDRPVDVDLQGGQDYMFNNPGQVWASAQAPVNAIMKYGKELSERAGGLDPLYMPWRMAPTGGDYANMTGETMLKYMRSNMNKKEQRAVNKGIKDFIPDFKGIESEEGIDQFRNAPDKVRKALKNHLDTKYRNAGGISIGEARLAVADPSQLLAPDTGLQNVGQIYTGRPIIQDSGHRAYSKGVPGQGLGVLDRDVMAYDLMPDVAEYRGLIDLKNPRTNDIRAIQMKPYGGIITDKILKNLGYAKGGEVSMDDLPFNDPDQLRLYHQAMKHYDDVIENTGASKKTGKGTARVNYSTLTKSDIDKENALHTLMANYGVDIGDLNLDAGLIKPMEADGLYIGDLTGSLPLGEGRASLGVQGMHSKYDDGLSGYTAGYNGKVGDGNLSARYFEPADHNSAGRQVQLEYAMPFAKGGEVKDLHNKYAEGGAVNTTPVSYGFEYNEIAKKYGLNNINYGGLNSGSTKTTTDTNQATADNLTSTNTGGNLTPTDTGGITSLVTNTTMPKNRGPKGIVDPALEARLRSADQLDTQRRIEAEIAAKARGNEYASRVSGTDDSKRLIFALNNNLDSGLRYTPEFEALYNASNPSTVVGGLGTDSIKSGFAKGGEVKALHDKYEESDYGYGNRPDKTKKGLGYFGELERPDGTGVMTEYSIGVPIHGEEMDVPTLVPTLTPDEIRLILHMQDGEDIPRSIVHKAIDHAHQRLSEGKPIFATEEDLYAHGGIVDVLHNDAIEQIMKAFMDSMVDDEEPSAPAVSIEITTQNTETPRRGKIPKSIAREAKHG